MSRWKPILNLLMTTSLRKILILGFYKNFNDQYFGNKKKRQTLSQDEVEIMWEINEILASGAPHPTNDERRDRLIDQYECQKQMITLRSKNVAI